MTSERLFPSDALAATGIQWDDWSSEVFSRARDRGVPVLLLVVNAWSGRCRRAALGLASDDELGEWLRERLVLTIVDADERPDVAARYADGAPPVAVVLTPDGDPLVQVEPVDPANLRTTVDEVLTAWSSRREDMLHETEAERHMRAAERATAFARRSPGVLTPAILDVALEVLDQADPETLDAATVGEAIRLYRYAHLRRESAGAFERAQELAWGLIAGGRFEGDVGAVLHARDDDAMSALDQATVLLALAELALADNEARESLEEPVERMVRFLVDVLGESHGGVRHAALDLDPDAVDPRVFSLTSARAARALVVAGIAYQRRDWIERGRRGVDFLLEHVGAGEAGMYHRWEGAASGVGFLRDQAEALLALLQVYEVSGTGHYLEQAQRLSRIVERDWREPGRGFRDLSALLESERSEQPGLLAETHMPLEGNVAMAEALLWIARLTHDEGLMDNAADVLAMFGTGLERRGVVIAGYARVVDRMLSAEPELKIVADQPPGESDQVADALMYAALRLRLAGRTVQRLVRDQDDDLLHQLGLPRDVGRAAYVCIGSACSAPLSQPEQLMPAVEEMIETRAL